MADYTNEFLKGILESTKVIAAVGVSANQIRPSYFVTRFMSLRGYTIIPVNPGLEGQTLFGQKVYASLQDIPTSIEVDMVDIFRRSEAVPPIVDDALTFLPSLRTVWMQVGVQNEGAAQTARAAGKSVIENRCPKIEYQRLFGELRKSGFNTGVISSRLPKLR